MGDQLKLDYYYGNEPDKFCFYRIPKVLFTKAYFEDLSTDAKVLYGLMLDMMASSRSNRWVDKENRVFIQFSIQRAMAYLGCGKDKAIKLFAELDTEKGIGLIERVGRGQGKADLIYVKSFEMPQDAEDNARIRKLRKRQTEKTFGPAVQKSGAGKPVESIVDNPPQVVGKTDRFEDPGRPPSEKVVGKTDQPEKPTTSTDGKVAGKTDRSEKPTPGSLDFRPQEVGFSDPNNTDYRNNDYNEYSPVMSCHRDRAGDDIFSHIDCSRPIRITMQSGEERQHGRDLRSAYIEILKDQVRYHDLMADDRYRFRKEQIDGMINMIADLSVTEPPDGIEWINSRPYSHEVVKSRLLKTDYGLLTHVLDRMGGNTTRIRNMRNYLLTALYNARDEFDMAMAARVNYDMYGGWEEKEKEGFDHG